MIFVRKDCHLIVIYMCILTHQTLSYILIHIFLYSKCLYNYRLFQGAQSCIKNIYFIAFTL